MIEYKNKLSKAVRYKYLSLILIIFFLIGITLFFIFGISVSGKPLIHILDLRKDSISSKLISKLSRKGITGVMIANYSEIRQSLADHKTKLVLEICENNNSSILTTKFYRNSGVNISPDALLIITAEAIQNFSKQNHLTTNILIGD